MKIAPLPLLIFLFAFITQPLLAQQAQKQQQVCLSSCVTLNKPALRVVALNWSAAEMLLSLGIKPVGVTLIKGYQKWQTNHPELPLDVAEVGRRQEPDLSTISQLQPDLIIGYEFRHRRLYDSLQSIAPTLLYQQFSDASDKQFNYFTQSQKVFLGIAQSVGKKTLAEQIINNMYLELAALKQQLKQAGLNDYPVSYGKFVGMGYGLRVFDQHSLAGSIASQLGLKYYWQQSLPGKDFTHLQLEQLALLQNSHLLLAGNQVDGERMTDSPVWSYLPFVKQKRYSQVPALFSFGGPVSALRMAKAFTHSLLNWQEYKDV